MTFSTSPGNFRRTADVYTGMQTIPAPQAQTNITDRIRKLSGYRSIFACWVAAILGEGGR